MHTTSQSGQLRSCILLGMGCCLFCAPPVLAQDARRGAALYMQLPDGGASCASCHGPEPQGNRNSLLKAADNPLALTKALSTVGVMSFLRASLDDAGVQDVAAFLGSVNRASSDQSALTQWPLTADFGTLGMGTVGGAQQVQIFNRGSVPLRLNSPQVQGNLLDLQHDCPAILPAGAVCRAVVTAWATVPGPFTGALSVSSPDQAAALVTAFAGVVKPVAAGVLQWSPDPGVITFSGAAAGQTASRRLTLINAGAHPVTLGAPPAAAGSITLTGANLAPLAATGCPAGTLLAPAATCEIDLQAAGGSPVAARAILQLRSNAANPPALRIEADAVASALPGASTPFSPTTAAPADGVAAGGGGGVSSLLWLTGLLLAAGCLVRLTALPHARAVRPYTG